MGQLWADRPDGTRPSSYPLIFLFSSLKWDRGVNYGRGYIAMNVEDRYEIPARPVSGKPTYRIDLTGRITKTISHDRLIRGCHEVAHSFGLGDEYSGPTNYSVVQSPENNIFDTDYVASCQTAFSCGYGEGRVIKLTGHFSW